MPWGRVLSVIERYCDNQFCRAASIYLAPDFQTESEQTTKYCSILQCCYFFSSGNNASLGRTPYRLRHLRAVVQQKRQFCTLHVLHDHLAAASFSDDAFHLRRFRYAVVRNRTTSTNTATRKANFVEIDGAISARFRIVYQLAFEEDYYARR